MNEFNVLLAAATNGTPSGSLFDALFARYIAPQESWRELESPLPITILAAGEDLIDYRIYGNTENGESVGERTENLLDKDLTKFLKNMMLTANGNETGNDFFCVSDYIPILPGTVYSVLNPNNGFGAYHCFYDSNKDFLMSFPANGQGLQTATSPPNASYIKCTLLSYTRYPEAFASSMLFEGSTAPASYIPYGYKLPLVVRSRNLFDKSNVEKKCYYDRNGVKFTNDTRYNESDYIPVEAGKVYTLYQKRIQTGFATAVNLYDTSRAFYKNVSYLLHPNGYYSVTPDIDGYIRFNECPPCATDYMFYEGSTAPTEYIPYYRDEENIYIGSDPLAEDEYVDFGEQKIYRVEGGTLTPTDPPVPIPALPTIEGETIIDYNPSTTPAVEPEKMYIKYKPQ